MEGAQQKIPVLNSKCQTLNSNDNESVSETELSHALFYKKLMWHGSNLENNMWEIGQEIFKWKEVYLPKKLNNNKKEVESNINNIQAEIMNLKDRE
jgi:hypothetical protein